MSLPEEILKQVKLLEINTRKLVNNLFAGEYHSAYKGQGMTFSEFREYVPGDDVRAISWPVTARTGKTFIKKYEEERELTLMLVVDVSGSEDFGSKSYFKGEVLTHVAALLSFSAARNNDAIGLLLFSDQVEHFVPPAKGRGQVHRILRDLLYFHPKSRQTKIAAAIEHLQAVLKKRSTIFLFSDFLDSGFDRPLRQISRRHDVVSVTVHDPLEKEIPDIGLIDLLDAETGETVLVDTSSPAFRRIYGEQMKKMNEQRDSELKRAQVERIEITAGEDIVAPLLAFFKKRQRR